MFKKIKSAKENIAKLVSAQETLDIVLEEEDMINHVLDIHGVDTVEQLISTFPSTAYYENIIDTYYDDDINLDGEIKNKEILAFYTKRKQDFADALEDFKQSDIYESFIMVEELLSKYEKLANKNIIV